MSERVTLNEQRPYMTPGRDETPDVTAKRAKPRTAQEIAAERLQKAQRTFLVESARAEAKKAPKRLEADYRAALQSQDRNAALAAVNGFYSAYRKLIDLQLPDVPGSGTPVKIQFEEEGEDASTGKE